MKYKSSKSESKVDLKKLAFALFLIAAVATVSSQIMYCERIQEETE